MSQEESVFECECGCVCKQERQKRRIEGLSHSFLFSVVTLLFFSEEFRIRLRFYLYEHIQWSIALIY